MNKDLITWLVFVGFIWVVFAIGLSHSEKTKLSIKEIELKALQAQVDKKYCKGEVIYSGSKEGFLGK